MIRKQSSADNGKQYIVQLVRDASSSGGVSNVVKSLDREFRLLGYETEIFSLASYRKRSKDLKPVIGYSKLRLLIDVLDASIFGTYIVRRRFKNKSNTLVISHNDFVYGDIFVNHGLHKALIKARGGWKKLFCNPIHVFLLFREEIRWRLDIHKVTINFSRAQQKEFLSHFSYAKAKLHICNNGVDLKRYQARSTGLSSARGFSLIFIGHEYDRKGLNFLLEAMKYLPDTVTLDVVGGSKRNQNGYTKLAAQYGVKNRVIFHGYIKDVVSYINKTDVLVLPSKQEAWALVPLEALACGVPVLATNVGSIDEFLIDGYNGLLITRDAKCIADKINRLVGNKDLYMTLKNNTRASVMRYDWKHIANQYIGVIKTINA